jgi:hypothetical protein
MCANWHSFVAQLRVSEGDALVAAGTGSTMGASSL